VRASVLGAAVFGCTAVAIVGCQVLEADTVRGDQPPWFSRANGSLHVQARRPLTAPERAVGEEYERGRPEIDPAHNRIFVGSSDHGLYALRASNLSTIWRFETLGQVQSEPLYDEALDAVYFGSHEGALYAVRAFDGHLLWRFNAGAEISRRPVLDGERLVFANAADQLFCVNRRTGKVEWHQHRTPALNMEIAGYAGPVLHEGAIIIAYSDGTLHSYAGKNGDETWMVDLAAEAEHGIAGEQERYLDVDTTPLLDMHPGGTHVVYAASYAGGVFARDAKTGEAIWRNEKAVGVTDLTLWDEPAHEPNPEGPERGTGRVPARKYVIASSATSGLWALDTLTGKKVWQVPIPEGGVTAAIPVAGALLVGTTRYGLFLLSPRNGRLIDGVDVGTGFAETPAAFGNRAFALSNGGTMLSVLVEPPRPTSPSDDCPWR
jgi:outer membrane protein assembly factor BamB